MHMPMPSLLISAIDRCLMHTRRIRKGCFEKIVIPYGELSDNRSEILFFLFVKSRIVCTSRLLISIVSNGHFAQKGTSATKEVFSRIIRSFFAHSATK